MKYYWKQKDGTLIDVDKMSVEHLRNTLKMIIRNTERGDVIPHDKFETSETTQLFNDSMEEIWDDEPYYSFLNH